MSSGWSRAGRGPPALRKEDSTAAGKALSRTAKPTGFNLRAGRWNEPPTQRAAPGKEDAPPPQPPVLTRKTRRAAARRSTVQPSAQSPHSSTSPQRSACRSCGQAVMQHSVFTLRSVYEMRPARKAPARREEPWRLKLSSLNLQVGRPGADVSASKSNCGCLLWLRVAL